MKRTLSRRQFLSQSSRAAAMALAFPTIIPTSARAAGAKAVPSERIRVGLIGAGGRGGFAKSYNDHPRAQLAALCDPVASQIAKFNDRFNLHGKCQGFADVREMLAQADIDAVHIATGDHWHVPMTLLSARAGKHCYTEKPLGLSIEQDLACREVTKKHGRVFQYGTQNRSIQYIRGGLEIVLNGHIGDVQHIEVWCPKGESGGSATPELPIPKGFNYDLWLGPAPMKPFSHDRCVHKSHRNGIFHIYDYAIGFIAGWGAHPLDQLQWWADQEGMGIPVRYEGKGTIPSEGLFDTLTHWDFQCTYANGLKMRFRDHESFHRAQPPCLAGRNCRAGHGTLFEGTKGWVLFHRSGWMASTLDLLRQAKNPGARRVIHSTHHAHNFIDAILHDRPTVSDLETAIQSDLVSHLCEISVRVGRPVTWDPKKQTIVGDTEAAQRMHRPMRQPWDAVLPKTA